MLNVNQNSSFPLQAEQSLLHTHAAHKLRTPNIRDKRDRRWFWVDNALMEDYASIIGIYAVGVYMMLSQRSYNQNQQSQVSGTVISDKLDVGRTTVTQALAVLEMHQLIDIEEQYDEETRQQLTSIYTLLSIDEWLLEPTPERKEFVNARRQAGIAKRTKPKKKQTRSARRQNSAPEDALNGDLDGDTSAAAGLRGGVPSGNTPPSLSPRSRRYNVTGHTICLRTPYDTPPGVNKYKEQDVEQDVEQDNNKQAQAQNSRFVADESSVELDLAPAAQASTRVTINQNRAETPTVEPASQKRAETVTVETTEQNTKKTVTAETIEQDLKKTLAQFAERRNIKATPDELDAIMQEWPAARLSDDQLAPALMGDYECFGLDKPAEARFARAAAAKNPARLRWFMCAWPGFEEASDDYHERTKHKWSKTRCFFNKWEELEPPSSWLQGELAALRGAVARQQREARTKEAKANLEGLTARQKDRLRKETLDILNEDAGNEYFTQSSDEFFYKRQQLLLDKDALQWLDDIEKAEAKAEAEAKAKAEAKAEAARARTLFSEGDEAPLTASFNEDDDEAPLAASLSEDDEDDEFEWVKPDQINVELYANPILAAIRAGSLRFADIDQQRAVLLEEEEWQRVKAVVEQRLLA